MAGEVHPVPFRTRKLSPLAPMVLRSKSVGEQDVADQRGAFAVSRRMPSKAPSGRSRRGPSLRLGFCVLSAVLVILRSVFTFTRPTKRMEWVALYRSSSFLFRAQSFQLWANLLSAKFRIGLNSFIIPLPLAGTVHRSPTISRQNLGDF